MHHLLVLVLHVLTGVTVVLVTPVTLVQHVRDAILALVDRPAWHAQIRMGVYFALALFSASFLNSYMSISNLFRAAAIVSSANSHHHHGSDGHGGGGHGADLAVAAGASDLHEHLVEAERDNILSTAVLLITALAASFAQLLRDHQRLTVRFVAMEKQASNASAAYMATLKSDTSATSTPAPKTTSSNSNNNSNSNNGKSSAGDSADANVAATAAALETAQTDLIAARAQIKQLQEEALKARQTADARVQAIKSQAENAQNEYERALSENARLKSQIKDYDVVFSGDRKKD